MTTYYFAIASQDFLLKEEPVEEILRERTNHYNIINKPIDFWLIKNPFFLKIKTKEMLTIRKQMTKPTAAIISHNRKFIDWIKLRFGFVLVGQFNSSLETIYT
uniref:Ycf54 n=1 Tax=Lympha mucosa TaxID=2045360 RepID=A0A6B9VRF3_9FLOR|nr:hypothetical protein [Lympha mucosa]